MKLSLVVASGAHAGKSIPVTVPQFVIGRDPQCQLRPASPSISKRHFAVLVKSGKVYVRDFGSTNGTFVNDKLVDNEIELKDGDTLKAGPLDFKVAITATAAKAEVKPVSKPVAAVAAVAAKGDEVDLSAPASDGPSSDNLAALLLEDDGKVTSSTHDTAEGIPDGSTLMDVPSPDKPGAAPAAPKKSAAPVGNTSDAAAEILKRYQRRPRSS